MTLDHKFKGFEELLFSKNFIPIFPKVPCIYLAISDEGKVVYVGKTTSKSRLKQHHKLKDFYDLNVVKIWYKTCSLRRLDSSETLWINIYRPLLNVRKKPTIEALNQKSQQREYRLQKAKESLESYEKLVVLSDEELKLVKKIICEKVKMMQADDEEYDRICGADNLFDMMRDLKSLADNLGLTDTDKDLFGDHFG